MLSPSQCGVCSARGTQSISKNYLLRKGVKSALHQTDAWSSQEHILGTLSCSRLNAQSHLSANLTLATKRARPNSFVYLHDERLEARYEMPDARREMNSFKSCWASTRHSDVDRRMVTLETPESRLSLKCHHADTCRLRQGSWFKFV